MLPLAAEENKLCFVSFYFALHNFIICFLLYLSNLWLYFDNLHNFWAKRLSTDDEEKISATVTQSQAY